MNTPPKLGAISEESRDELVAQTVRNLRLNPNGIAGPLVIRWIVLLLAATDTGEVALDPLELDQRTSAAISSLERLCTRPGRKRARDDARWALHQIGLTPDSASDTLADDSKLREIVAELWAEKLTRLALEP
jgi:hypothetical protein